MRPRPTTGPAARRHSHPLRGPVPARSSLDHPLTASRPIQSLLHDRGRCGVSALFTAYRYISEGTYDPKYESTYWLRFILGLMAGLLLPALIPIGGQAGDSTLTKPLLALLGGFSAAMLYRVLERLVNTVESLVQADSRELRTAVAKR